ncbi:MbtH family protein [Streptomyces sp. NPDC048111]|uniref:MbtH family protein n=1 Tax=Streptomyces sp. NPDC048111 TaxID=3365500 RepID=UPI0037216633
MSDAPTNPFDADGESAAFTVLVNARDEHSLWPSFAAVPDGWHVVHGPCPRAEALEWIDAHWTALASGPAR